MPRIAELRKEHAVRAHSETIAFIAMVCVLIVAPVFAYPIFLMKALCFALFACAFNLLIGYVGLLSVQAGCLRAVGDVCRGSGRNKGACVSACFLDRRGLADVRRSHPHDPGRRAGYPVRDRVKTFVLATRIENLGAIAEAES